MHMLQSRIGGVLPSMRNLANLPEAIASIPQGPATLSDFKNAVRFGNAQKRFPIGTEFVDVYGGQNNPVIVVQYLDSTNNSTYGGAEGALLQRKYATDVGQRWNTTDNNASYLTSAIYSYLTNTHFNNLSQDLKDILNDISIAVSTSGGISMSTAKLFLPSMEEMYGDASVAWAPGTSVEGSYFPYWKDKTGLDVPSNGNNAGRQIKRDSESGAIINLWLRSRYSGNATNVWIVGTNGNIGSGATNSTNRGIIPVYFVGKD